MKIPLLDLKAQYKKLELEINNAIKEVMENTRFIMGKEVKDFEKDIEDYIGCKYAISCASGSDALLLSLMAMDIGEGDEVITTPYTFFATAGAITRLGAKPVFVDIKEEDCNIDEDLIEGAITDKTKAIIPVHLYGKCANMQRILQIAQKYNLYVIEDACQSIGANYKFSTEEILQAGNIGHTGCFSFFPSKNLGAYGDAGMITTNDSEIAEKLKVLRVHGSKPKYFHKVIGINSRMDTIQAAILKVKLNYLKEWTESRIEKAKIYDKLIKKYNLDQKLKYYPFYEYDKQHIYHQFVIQTDKRDELLEYLKTNEIGCAIYYPLSLHIQECFNYLGYKVGDMPVAEKKAKSSLALPIYPELTDEQQNYIIMKIKDFFR